MSEDYTKMGKDNCPACNYLCDSASVANGKHQVPLPGDLSVCLNCGEWLEFSSDMALIKMPERTMKNLGKENLKILTIATTGIKKRGPLK